MFMEFTLNGDEITAEQISDDKYVITCPSSLHNILEVQQMGEHAELEEEGTVITNQCDFENFVLLIADLTRVAHEIEVDLFKEIHVISG